MWVDVKQRLIAILQTLPKVGDTNRTIAVSVPQDRSDFHGYLIVVRPQRDAVQTPQSADTRTHVLTFAIDCFSPQINTGIVVENEYRIEAYADAITALLEQYPTLGDPKENKRGLTGVQNLFVSGTQFQSPRAYVEGNPIQYYSCSVSLQVTFRRSTGC